MLFHDVVIHARQITGLDPPLFEVIPLIIMFGMCSAFALSQQSIVVNCIVGLANCIYLSIGYNILPYYVKETKPAQIKFTVQSTD